MSYHSGNQLIDPEILFKKAHLQPGMHIADLGCGKIGHIIFPAASIIGEEGTIYAVDILQEALEGIKRRAQIENLLNIHTVWSDLEQVGYTAIPEGSLDVGFIVNCLSQSRNPYSLLTEAVRLLKDKARLVIVDWREKIGNLGPEEDMMVNFEDLKNWAKNNGLFLQEEFVMGNYHQGVVFYKHD